MPPIEAAGANAEQILYWNETAGPKWVALQDMIDAQIESHGVAAMDRAGVASGHDVIDVGCGCGQTSIELGRRVGPEGSVLGVDVSAPMLARAAELAAARRLDHVRFARADAQTHPLPDSSADLVFSRFGVMFFADPPAAFANLRRALRRDGGLTFLCWQAVTENPWMLTPLLAAAEHIPLPAPPAPGAPGPFAFANADHVRGILTRAGFADISFESVRREVTLGGTGGVDVAVDFALQMGPTGAALRDAGPELLAKVRTAVRNALEPHATADGVRLGSAAWLVRARPAA
jgi:SAM-dependent methyltransferase